MILEIVWTVIPLGLSMIMFAWGASIFFTESRPPADSMEIYVTGKQWMWKIQHMEGAREINELHIPVDRNIRLTMTSEDVIHDFYRAGVPHQDRRAAGQIHDGVVPADEGRRSIISSAPSIAAPSTPA